MKPVIFTVLLACWLNTSNAQIVIALLFGDKLNTGKMEFGLVASPTFTNISNNESKLTSAFNFGIYLNFNTDKMFSLHIEGIAKGALGAGSIKPYPTGNDSLDAFLEGGSVKRKIKVFSLPVLCRYRLSGKLFFELGIQPDLLLKVEDIFTADVSGHELKYTLEKSEDYTKLDLAMATGVSYKFLKDKRSVGMGLRYVQGLTDIYKAGAGTQANYMWQIVVTIPVGGVKSK
jgi:hypothetical protein